MESSTPLADLSSDVEALSRISRVVETLRQRRESRKESSFLTLRITFDMPQISGSFPCSPTTPDSLTVGRTTVVGTGVGATAYVDG
jgi:hypothetical protein